MSWLWTEICLLCEQQQRHAFEPSQYPVWLKQLEKKVLAACIFEIDLIPDCANANLYESGSHSCGWHSDDENLFATEDDGSTIVSVSLGAERCSEI